MNTQITIEKGVPLPPRRTAPSLCSNLLASMEPGDSFIVPLEEGRKMQHYKAYHNAVNWARRSGRKVTARLTPEGLRIWRVS